MSDHAASDRCDRTDHLREVAGTDLLRAGAHREKRQEIQDVQVPQYVSGCGGTQERPDRQAVMFHDSHMDGDSHFHEDADHFFRIFLLVARGNQHFVHPLVAGIFHDFILICHDWNITDAFSL